MKIKVKKLNLQIADGYLKMNSMPDDPVDSVAYAYGGFPTEQKANLTKTQQEKKKQTPDAPAAA